MVGKRSRLSRAHCTSGVLLSHLRMAFAESWDFGAAYDARPIVSKGTQRTAGVPFGFPSDQDEVTHAHTQLFSWLPTLKVQGSTWVCFVVSVPAAGRFKGKPNGKTAFLGVPGQCGEP